MLVGVAIITRFAVMHCAVAALATDDRLIAWWAGGEEN